MTFVKVISGILGFLAAIVAIPLLVISAGMFSLTDGDEVTLPTISATTSSRAMTFGEIDLDWDGSIVIDDVEEIGVAVDGDGLFVGVARTNDVDRFLATDLPPQSVDIWLDDASGSDPVIDIDTEGLWTAVVMNADGSRGSRRRRVSHHPVGSDQGRFVADHGRWSDGGDRCDAAVRRGLPQAPAPGTTGRRASA